MLIIDQEEIEERKWLCSDKEEGVMRGEELVQAMREEGTRKGAHKKSSLSAHGGDFRVKKERGRWRGRERETYTDRESLSQHTNIRGP